MSLIGSIFKNQSPWGSSGPTGGSGNGSGSRREPPNIDELIRNIQNKINRFMPGGKSGGGKPIVLGLIIEPLQQLESIGGTNFKNIESKSLQLMTLLNILSEKHLSLAPMRPTLWKAAMMVALSTAILVMTNSPVATAMMNYGAVGVGIRSRAASETINFLVARVPIRRPLPARRIWLWPTWRRVLRKAPERVPISFPITT